MRRRITLYIGGMAVDLSDDSFILFNWAFEDLMHLPQGKGGGAVIQRYPDRVRPVPVRSPQELADVDRPEDLEVLRALGKGRPEPDPI